MTLRPLSEYLQQNLVMPQEVARLDMDIEQSYEDYLASLRAIRVEEKREERGRDRKL